ncbi:MAG: DUF1573 domain-containing protein [Bacteroidota bacterium]
MRKQHFYLVLVCVFVACGETTTAKDERNAQQTVEKNEIMDVIRNPVTAGDAPIDTTDIAKLVFAEERYDFGEVDAGAVIEHTYTFTNSGTVPLLISDVRSTCGCTVAEWPKAPIAPGSSGRIPVRFDTKGKSGRQSKPVTITANTFPAKTVLYLDGRVYALDN